MSSLLAANAVKFFYELLDETSNCFRTIINSGLGNKQTRILNTSLEETFITLIKLDCTCQSGKEIEEHKNPGECCWTHDNESSP